MSRRAQQAAATKENILKSTIQLIKKEGFGAASTSNIAHWSGTTWGAAQHHFGSKEAIFIEILRLSHQNFIHLLSEPSLAGQPLYLRVEEYVDRMCEHYLSDTYAAALGILMATHGEAILSTHPVWEGEQIEDTLRITQHIFSDCNMSNEELRKPLIMAHCTLTGLSVWKVLEQELASPQYLLDRLKINFYSILKGM